MTRDEAARIVEGRIKNPTPPVDRRGFWVRLLDSLRIGAKVKKRGAEIQITGGTDF
jgi:hypothetical protein